MQDMKMKDQVASHENAGRENAGMKMQDRNM